MRVTVVQTEKCSPMPIYGGKRQLGMVCEGGSPLAGALMGWRTTSQCWARKPKILGMCWVLGPGEISAEVGPTVPKAWWACEGQVPNVCCELYRVNLVTKLLEVGQRLWEATCREETSPQAFLQPVKAWGCVAVLLVCSQPAFEPPGLWLRKRPLGFGGWFVQLPINTDFQHLRSGDGGIACFCWAEILLSMHVYIVARRLPGQPC